MSLISREFLPPSLRDSTDVTGSRFPFRSIQIERSAGAGGRPTRRACCDGNDIWLAVDRETDHRDRHLRIINCSRSYSYSKQTHHHGRSTQSPLAPRRRCRHHGELPKRFCVFPRAELTPSCNVQGGYYAFNQPLKEASADLRRPSSHAHSQTGKEISGGSQGAAGPHNSLRDGVSQVDPTAQTVAGTTESARKSYSGEPREP